MKSLYILLIISFYYSTLSAQAPLVKQWDKRYGGTKSEWLHAVQQTADEGYILGGYTTSDEGGDVSGPSRDDTLIPQGDYWILKTDSLGNKLWDKRFGATYADRLYSLHQTRDGGYILGGGAASDSTGDISQRSRGGVDFWVVKTNATGNKEWERLFGGTSREEVNSIQQTADGGFIFGGWTVSDSCSDISQQTKGDADYWVVKTDSAGNKEWDRRYGGMYNDELFELHQTTDGGYILGGYSNSDSSGDVSQPSRGDRDFWIVKIDALGAKLWDKRFGGGMVDDFYSLFQTSDGGYALAGITFSDSSADVSQATKGNSDYWLVKTDSLGNKQWDKRFGGSAAERNLGYVRPTADGGYLLSGNSLSAAGGDKTENNLGPGQIWVLKADSLGIKQWDKTIFTDAFDTYGYTIQTIDGCYAIAVGTGSGIAGYQTQLSKGQNDYWLVKFCDTVAINTGIHELSEADVVSVYPNPLTDGGWQMAVGNNFIGGDVEIIDGSGKLVFQSKITHPKSKIETRFAKGVYLMRISSAKSSVVRKLIKM
jgi:hypothetical protein